MFKKHIKFLKENIINLVSYILTQENNINFNLNEIQNMEMKFVPRAKSSRMRKTSLF